MLTSSSGIATFYDPNTGNQGACGGYITTEEWSERGLPNEMRNR